MPMALYSGLALVIGTWESGSGTWVVLSLSLSLSLSSAFPSIPCTLFLLLMMLLLLLVKLFFVSDDVTCCCWCWSRGREGGRERRREKERERESCVFTALATSVLLNINGIVYYQYHTYYLLPTTYYLCFYSFMQVRAIKETTWTVTLCLSCME